MKRPNIIMIITDHQRYDTINALGYNHMVTPNMDRIVNKGTSYTNAFICGATCIASRAALFTGMHNHNTGVYSFYLWSHNRSWVHDLHDSGYYTVNIGKMHIAPRDESYGFDDRVVVENPSGLTYQKGLKDDAYGKHLRFHGGDRIGLRHRTDPNWRKKFQSVPWEMEDHMHPDVFIGQSAVAFIDKHEMQGDTPLFLEVGFTGPHEPYSPLKRHLAMYDDKVLPKANYKDGELKNKPPQHLAQQDKFNRNDGESQINMPNATDEDIAMMRKHYFASITTLDEQIGHILDSLENRGLLDNAIVMLTCDHGDLLGDHKIPYKWLMYDPVVRVPLVIWDTNDGVAKLDDRLASHIDVGPTMLDYAGVKKPPYLEGESMRSDHRNKYVFSEDTYLTMIRDERYKMVYYTYQEDIGELYDLEKDPNEYVNLFDDEEYSDVRLRMEKELLKFMLRSNYKTTSFKTGNMNDPVHWPFAKDQSLLAVKTMDIKE